ncbi:reverse transcriptase [Caerostris darwini]|uniref:Reverse transcriptase n=1 Tax=Caerostris darwini TaxID=1538125 RepID=A0AAV4PYS8_9ARAC|nr:reverse transcriptase [Caerostris darwini]
MLVEMKILLISRPVACHLQHSLWLCGPEFLYNECSFHSESSVPTLNDSVSTLNDSMSTLNDSVSTLNDFVSTLNDPVPEERCCVQSTIAANHLPNSNDLFQKYSSLSKLKGVAAYCLRVSGRLRHANIAYGHKHPILLPKRHILTNLIVRYYHEILLHAGPQLVKSSIQEQYWIIGDAILGFPDDLKYLPGNTVVIQKGKTISITCRLNGLTEFPRWIAPNLQNVEVRAMCPHLNESEGMHISYTDNLNEGSIVAFHGLPPR